MSELNYTKTHEWVKQEDAECIVGITQHAQELLGDMVFVELPELGREVVAGDEMAVVESVKAASDVYAPVSGTIIDINKSLSENPALLNQDPYGAGWLVKIKPSNVAELDTLLSSKQYEQEIKED